MEFLCPIGDEMDDILEHDFPVEFTCSCACRSAILGPEGLECSECGACVYG